MTCTFCEIISKNLPARIVKETEETLAFLDIDPIQKGHVLVIPKRHVPDLTDMTDVEMNQVMTLCKEVMSSLRTAYNPDSISIIQNNGECMAFPHVHFHVVPRFTGDGFVMREPEITVSDEEMDRVARELEKNML
ncbi:HIT family protein [Paenisporosarcina indica]|uniref:HIT family protein n=1 Tax=Paenisporosarcina indica TaxID=650093 RepID=UPI00094F5A71|nr:HIT family protein [Paenisporosarcina indica]